MAYVISDECVACGTCAGECPVEAISEGDGKYVIVNVKMIDQGSSELNIIIGVENRDFETAIRAIYDIFVTAQL